MSDILVRIVAPVADGASRRQSLQALCDVTFALNVQWLKAHPEAPALYASGVRYGREPPEVREEFRTIPATLAQGWGDCDDLAPWRAAELFVRGGHRDVRPLVRQIRPGLWHVVVGRGGRQIEDPCKRLGMGDDS